MIFAIRQKQWHRCVRRIGCVPLSAHRSAADYATTATSESIVVLKKRGPYSCYRPLDTEQARAKCELERQLLLIDSGDGENVGKVPTGAALRRIRDALNTEIFQSTDPIVNGDVDVKYLCFDIKRTVQNVDQMRIGEGDATFDYRIHFL